jgi:hypothetical protein
MGVDGFVLLVGEEDVHAAGDVPGKPGYGIRVW